MSRRRMVAMSVATIFLAGSAVAQETKMKRSDLPLAVEKTVAEASQGGTVTELSKETEHGKLTYEAVIVTNGHTKSVEMDSHGLIVEVEDEVSLDAVPAEVKSKLLTKAGAGKILKVETVTKSGTVVKYEAVVDTAGKKSEVSVDGK